ncbi:MAG: hypothetical protein JWR69_78 [Pedosphaera sp.]|nr:hypothetical protein [Pedosphaera sp.]
MKIVCQPVDAAGADTGSPITLGDDSVGDYIVGPPFRAESRLVDQAPLYGAATPYTNDQGNRRNSYSWTVEREHATKAAATAFNLGHANSLPGNCRLTITEGAADWRHAGCTFTAVECVLQTGIATTFRYSITGGTLASA